MTVDRDRIPSRTDSSAYPIADFSAGSGRRPQRRVREPHVPPRWRRLLRAGSVFGLLGMLAWLVAAAPATAASKTSQAAPRQATAQPAVASERTALLTKPAKPPGAKPRKPRGKTAWITVAGQTARRYGVSGDLVHAVILAESAYDPKALSHKGAMGLMQLIPETATRYGVTDPWDPAQNLDGGVRYLRDLLGQFKDTGLAVAAYNAGETAVARYGNEIPPYDETQGYVAKVEAYLARLEAGAAVKSLIGKGVAAAPRLSGWGLIFGFFPDQAEARAAVQRQRAKLKAVMARGRTAIVPRELENGTRYGALLVGLKEQDASAACKHLRSLRAYCLALTPGELKDPEALWRS